MVPNLRLHSYPQQAERHTGIPKIQLCVPLEVSPRSKDRLLFDTRQVWGDTGTDIFTTGCVGPPNTTPAALRMGMYRV